MPIQHIGQQPPSMLSRTTCLWIVWNPLEKLFHHWSDTSKPSGYALIRRAVLAVYRSYDLNASIYKLRSARFKPVPKSLRRSTIVLVVPAYNRACLFANRRGIAKFEMSLQVGQCAVRFGKRRLPHEAVERLQSLNRIALDAGTHAMADDRIEVHEQPCAQHAIKLIFPRSVPSHQPLECSRLVRRIVI